MSLSLKVIEVTISTLSSFHLGFTSYPISSRIKAARMPVLMLAVTTDGAIYKP